MGQKRQMQERINAVWKHGYAVDSPPSQPYLWRYVPRAYTSGLSGWGVYDRRLQKFIEDDDLLAIPVAVLASETLTN